MIFGMRDLIESPPLLNIQGKISSYCLGQVRARLGKVTEFSVDCPLSSPNRAKERR